MGGVRGNRVIHIDGMFTVKLTVELVPQGMQYGSVSSHLPARHNASGGENPSPWASSERLSNLQSANQGLE